MVHLFRAEVNRANIWRQRLDTTTNWAVITTFAVLSIAFTQTRAISLSHSSTAGTFFLFIEAVATVTTNLWSYRIRLMETTSSRHAGASLPPIARLGRSSRRAPVAPAFPISTWKLWVAASGELSLDLRYHPGTWIAQTLVGAYTNFRLAGDHRAGFCWPIRWQVGDS